MGKSRTHGRDKKKSAQLVLRVEKGERDAFVALCEAIDTTAAREIRRFMRDFVARHAPPEANPAPKPRKTAEAIPEIAAPPDEPAEVPPAP